MNGAATILAAVTTFVGTHFLLSHPLRRSLVATLGEKGFLGVYSLVAFATLGTTIWAYRMAALTPPLWEVSGDLWAASTILMLIASILLMGSLVRNPALVGAEGSAATASARGVYAVTRHPMMWAFAIWGLAHILIYPVTKNMVLSGGIMVLALVGAALQDRKKAKLEPQGWSAWVARTSFLPFAAIIAGRAKLGSFGMHALAGGLAVWLAATWAHIPLAGWPAGIWRWIV